MNALQIPDSNTVAVVFMRHGFREIVLLESIPPNQKVLSLAQRDTLFEVDESGFLSIIQFGKRVTLPNPLRTPEQADLLLRGMFPNRSETIEAPQTVYLEKSTA